MKIDSVIGTLERISELAAAVAKELAPASVASSDLRFYVLAGSRLRCRRGHEQFFYSPDDESWHREPVGDLSKMGEWSASDVERTFGERPARGPDELPF